MISSLNQACLPCVKYSRVSRSLRFYYKKQETCPIGDLLVSDAGYIYIYGTPQSVYPLLHLVSLVDIRRRLPWVEGLVVILLLILFSRESAVRMDQKTEVENPLSIQNHLNDSQRDTSQAASNTYETSSQDNKVLMKNSNLFRPKNNALEKKLAKSQI